MPDLKKLLRDVTLRDGDEREAGVDPALGEVELSEPREHAVHRCVVDGRAVGRRVLVADVWREEWLASGRRRSYVKVPTKLQTESRTDGAVSAQCRLRGLRKARPRTGDQAVQLVKHLGQPIDVLDGQGDAASTAREIQGAEMRDHRVSGNRRRRRAAERSKERPWWAGEGW